MRTGTATAQIATFETALDNYRRDVGAYPSTTEGLNALLRIPGRAVWDGPYMPQDVPTDPWGSPYVYAFPGHHGREPDIVSHEADRLPGRAGAKADIVSWSLSRR